MKGPLLRLKGGAYDKRAIRANSNRELRVLLFLRGGPFFRAPPLPGRAAQRIKNGLEARWLRAPNWAAICCYILGLHNGFELSALFWLDGFPRSDRGTEITSSIAAVGVIPFDRSRAEESREQEQEREGVKFPSLRGSYYTVPERPFTRSNRQLECIDSFEDCKDWKAGKGVCAYL
ncbi:hypothetical protein V6N12_075898 [Hibiscus sabdariffa]|uniref:Uncharacterized protein n=1 Tax=Hibiscus sabdariffa TaxID=183260 RepID=A0ABR2AXM3_9ROSI